jgi:hypothetical protein
VFLLVKDNSQNEDIKTESANLATTVTAQQKDYENFVIAYQKKINDFNNLFKNHEFVSNVFAFMQTQTMPDIWFKQFNLDEKTSTVQLSGEAENMDVFSRQVAVFEQNKYVKSLGNLSSSIGTTSSKIEFNLNLTLDQSIFSYISDTISILGTATPLQQASTQQNQTAGSSDLFSASGASNNSSVEPGAPNAPTDNSQGLTQNSNKLIISFNLLLNPKVIGIIDETNSTVTLNVPYGANIKKVLPEVVVSPGDTLSPISGMPQDFTTPLTYKVTAQDGSIQNYKVIVNILPKTNSNAS